MSFHTDFADILGEGMGYQVFESSTINEIRVHEEEWTDPDGITYPGPTIRMIQYEIDGTDFKIHSLYIKDEPGGGGHILRIAKASAQLFLQQGYERILGYKFDSTEAGLSFKTKALNAGGYEEGDWTVLDITNFQKLKNLP